jgi:hypothetical protein
VAFATPIPSDARCCINGTYAFDKVLSPSETRKTLLMPISAIHLQDLKHPEL